MGVHMQTVVLYTTYFTYTYMVNTVQAIKETKNKTQSCNTYNYHSRLVLSKGKNSVFITKSLNLFVSLYISRKHMKFFE